MHLFNATASTVGANGEQYEGVDGVFDLPQDVADHLVKFPEWEPYTGQVREHPEDATEAPVEGAEPAGDADAPAEPATESTDPLSSREAMLAFADAHGIKVDGRLNDENLRAALVAATASSAPATEDTPDAPESPETTEAPADPANPSELPPPPPAAE